MMRKKVGGRGLAVLLALLLLLPVTWKPIPVFAETEAVICENITIDGISVGGKTAAEAESLLSGREKARLDTPVTLTSNYGNVETTLGELGYHSEISAALHEAVGYGNTGNILKRYRERQQINSVKNIPLLRGISEEKLKQVVNDSLQDVFNGTETLKLEKKSETSVEIVYEGEHVRLDSAATMNAMGESMEKLTSGALSLEASIFVADNEDQEEREALSHIRDLLGTYTTKFSRSDEGRNQNIKRAAELMNGKILFPGEEVSTYYTIDPIVASNGYEMAGVFVNNEVVPGIGGGVCQMSSTLYNALLYAEVEIVKRDYHGLPVSYVPLSYDATMAGGYLDLIFRNNLEYPIYVECDCNVDRGYITCNIYGQEYRDPRRSIEFGNKIIEKIEIPEEPKIEEDPEMAPGTEEVVSNGKVGYRTELWKYVYYDGELQDEVLINKSKYNATPKKIKKGPEGESEDTENTELTEDTEDTEDTENTESTETTEDTEDPGSTENRTDQPVPGKKTEKTEKDNTEKVTSEEDTETVTEDTESPTSEKDTGTGKDTSSEKDTESPSSEGDTTSEDTETPSPDTEKESEEGGPEEPEGTE